MSYDFSHHPCLFNATKLGRDMRDSHGDFKRTVSMSLTNAGQAVAKNIVPTCHWGSEYKHILKDKEGRNKSVSNRPLWSIYRQAYSSARGYYSTEYSELMGKLGHNPRNLLPHDSTKQENSNNVLTIGTTKVTKHIPGYSGFIPSVDVNPTAVSHGEGKETRETIIKQNIVENYPVRVPGYQGHRTMSVVNDRGDLRPHCLSTKGESF